MKEIYLSKGIYNEGEGYDGYIDSIINQIKSVPENEDLKLLVTSTGGDVFQGERLTRAILEHKGETFYVGIGMAASMAGNLISAFDNVEIDKGIEFMLHQAHSEGNTPEINALILRANKRAYDRLVAKGGDEPFLRKVFLSSEKKDFYISTDDFKKYGLGKVTEIKRENSEPYKVAAKLEYKSNTMSEKKAETLKIIESSNGKQYVFTSANDKPSKGDVLTMVGSNELITGALRFGSVVASVGEGNTVEAVIDEVESVEGDVMTEIKDIKNRLAALEEKAGSEETTEMSKDEDEEVEASAVLTEMKSTLASIQASAEDLKKKQSEFDSKIVATGSTFVMPKGETKHETIYGAANFHLTQAERHAADLREVRDNI